jgi:PAS domain S-box-containing protein
VDAESLRDESLEPPVASPPPEAARPRGFGVAIAVFVCMAAVVLATGVFAYRQQAAAVRRQQGRELAAIRDLKAAEISRWFAGEQTSARAAGENPILAGAVKRWTSRGAPPPTPFVVRSLIDTMRGAQGYPVVLLLDPALRTIHAAPRAAPAPDAVTRTLGTKVLDRREVVFSDLYQDVRGSPKMEFLSPLTGGGPAASRPPAVLALELDPAAFLLPLVSSWPTTSKTGETLLVERRGGKVVFLSARRRRTAAARVPALPIAKSEAPAVKAARGVLGVVSGIDYSGTDVLAAVGPVRGTPWFIVSKIDVSEVDAPLRRLALVTTFIVLGVLLLGGAAILFFWSRWRAGEFRRLYEIERALRASEQLFKAGFEHAPVGVVFRRPDGTVRQANATFAKMLGYTVAELDGMSVVEITHPDDRAETASLIAATLAGAHDHSEVQKRYLRKDGSSVWTTVNVTLLRDERGRPVDFMAMVSDVSTRKAAEDALIQSEERFRGLFETALIGFALHEVVCDDAGVPVDYVFLEANEAFGEYTGLVPAEIVGRRATEVIAGVEASGRIELYGEVALGGDARRFETYFEPFDRHYDIQVSSPQPGQFTTVFLDVTERKQAEQGRREAERELAETNVHLERRVLERTLELEAANEELEAFSYSVSHDLRSPLRALDGFSLALLEDYGDVLDDTAMDYLARVRAGAQRMGALIDDMLVLSRASRGEMTRRDVDLAALARDVVADLRRADPGREVEFTLPETLAVNGDPGLMRTLLENLLGNAWKFTSRKPAAHIELGVDRRGGAVACFVRDDGVGFDPAYVDKLFTPFQRLHTTKEFPGTGIGLATVQRILRRHGGRAWAEGVVDGGASVYFTFGTKEED